MSGKFRVTLWDPFLISSQILTIQALYYASLAAQVLVIDFLFSKTPSISHLFSYYVISVHSLYHIAIIFCFLINAFLGGIYLWHFVGRAKRCLDFSITCHLIHLLGCWICNGFFPDTFSWWILSTFSTAIMCVLGEYLCMRSEINDIPLLSAGSDV